MGSKVKSFFASLGYLVLSFGIQLAVSFVASIGLIIYHLVTNVSSTGESLEAVVADVDSMVNFVVGATSWILLFSSIITILALILIYKIKKRKVKEELLINGTKPINYLSAFLLGALCWFFNSAVLTLVSSAGVLENQFNKTDNILAPLLEGSLIITFITVGIVAPIAEEFLFRGVVFNTLQKRFSSAWTIVIQGVLFGVFHLNLVQGSYATILGIVYGYVTYKTKSLWPAIIMHIVNNSMPFIMTIIFGDYNFSTTASLIQAIVAVIGMAVILFLVSRTNPKVSEETPLDVQY
ncbi:CPBP family intramembrane metalloprotease [Clostridium sartagoforme]|uniref:CPBP family intramembrane metalloprotease n=1 Tax=Clostridium sartagoforme TaxID=84031 RepID=A0A4S2DN95_9CLOT|nr:MULTISPECIES: CPBP family intramembrane glutamic endopeptidase [Clostridium]MBS5939599.1 CPBP family intramembrane metalloprotease [Clostridium sp.]TGY43242.1 CPBP family intramembrane metalloprotease [Clostridium sartagoforme]